MQFEKETYFSRRTDGLLAVSLAACGSGLSSQEMQNMEKYAKAAGQSFEYSSLNHITDVKVAVPSGRGDFGGDHRRKDRETGKYRSQ